MRFRIAALVFALLMSVGSFVTFAQESEPASDEPTLIVYSSVEQLLGGDVTIGIPIAAVAEELGNFDPTWSVVGLGTTNQVMRNGELMPDGTAAHLRYWWVDPSSDTQAAVVDLATAAEIAGATPVPGAPSPAVTVDFEPEFPLIALAVADSAEALTFEAENVDNVHDWIVATLAETDVTLAGLQVTGSFGEVNTTVGYHLPTTGVDISTVYQDRSVFHFLDYQEPATWVMNGFYAAEAELQPVVSVAGRPVHLHGYQPEAMLGGHIATAAAADVTLTVYPLENVVQTRPDDEA